VPDLRELQEQLERARGGLARGARRSLERHTERLAQTNERLRRAPRLLVERRRAALEQAAGRLRALSPRATLNRGYAIVRANDQIIRSAAALGSGEQIEVEVAEGRFGAHVD
jgi:exodeoxyribonuclease VII large subunit